jgi:hypothetical protein
MVRPRIIQHRCVAIDGAAIAAITRLFAQLPAAVRDADRIDRPGKAEVRLFLADEHRGSAITGVAIDRRFWRAIRAVAFSLDGLGI